MTGDEKKDDRMKEGKRAPHLGQADPGELLAERLGSFQGLLVVQHRDAHHGSLYVGAGHHQDLPQSETHTHTHTETKRKLHENLIYVNVIQRLDCGAVALFCYTGVSGHFREL